MVMDLVKHIGVFQPQKVAGKRIAIIGAGAIGSAVALNVAKLGVTNITLFDFDKVEAHNLPNQILYGPSDIGANKVDAAASRIESLTGYKPKTVVGKAGESKMFYEIIFVCVDSMDARTKIFQKAVYLNGVTELLIEGRMGARAVAAYAFNPLDPSQAQEYVSDLYPDSDVPRENVGACAVIPSIGATANTVAAMMTWQFINGTQGTLLKNEILFSVDPWEFRSSRKFKNSLDIFA